MSAPVPGSTFHVGTSGFSYDEWRPAFYPDDLKKDAMLSFYAERLPAVELNNTFYRLPNAKMTAKWRAAVPASFRFAVKASQRLTWTQKLKDCGELLFGIALLAEGSSLPNPTRFSQLVSQLMLVSGGAPSV